MSFCDASKLSAPPYFTVSVLSPRARPVVSTETVTEPPDNVPEPT